MLKHSEMISWPANMFLKIFLISFLLHYSLSFDAFDDGKRQGFTRLSQTGGERSLADMEDKSFAGGMVAYPRLGRLVTGFQQTLLPNAQSEGLVPYPGPYDADDLLFNTGIHNPAEEEQFSDAFLSGMPVDETSTRLKSGMHPYSRIDRQKRSIPDAKGRKETGGSGKEFPDHSRITRSSVDNFDNDYDFRQNKKNPRSKYSFIPRLGKKRSDYPNEYEEKRAAAFTPRIGRASLIPRIGRSDTRFRLKSRVAFVPRIGRRAALIPRIGRSENQWNSKEDSD